jgi:hypothetical protein
MVRRLNDPEDFAAAHARWSRWWLSGLNPPSSASTALRLVRQLEFFFIIWQTLFEAATQAFAYSRRARFRSLRVRDPLAQLAFILARNEADLDEPTSREVVELCLLLHDKLVAPQLDGWEKRTKKLLNGSAAKFVSLHGERTVKGMMRFSGNALLQELAALHEEYCEIQEKPYAVYAASLYPKPKIIKVPLVSARMVVGRWGLFGYRCEAAVGLHDSA